MDRPTEQTSAGGVTETNWPLVLLLIGVGVICAFQIGKVPPALLDLRRSLGLGLVASGWVLAIYSFIAATIGIAAGAFADAFGHRRIILWGLAGIALPGLAASLMPNPTMLLVSRFVEGIGYIVILVSVPSLIFRVTRPPDLRLALGFWGAWAAVGISIMMVISPVLIAPFGWRGLWLANVVIVALYGVVFAFFTRHLTATAGGSARPFDGLWGRITRIVTAPAAVVLAGGFAVYTMNWIAVTGLLPILLIDVMGMGEVTASLLTALAFAATIVGTVGASYLIHRGVPRWILMVASYLGMALASTGIYSESLPPETRYAICVAFTMLCGLVPASVFAATPSVAPSPALVATLNGLIIQGANLGLLLGPPVMGAAVVGAGGWQVGPWVVVATSVIGMALVIPIARHEAHSRQ